jgi:hypothetical protein
MLSPHYWHIHVLANWHSETAIKSATGPGSACFNHPPKNTSLRCVNARLSVEFRTSSASLLNERFVTIQRRPSSSSVGLFCYLNRLGNSPTVSRNSPPALARTGAPRTNRRAKLSQDRAARTRMKAPPPLPIGHAPRSLNDALRQNTHTGTRVYTLDNLSISCDDRIV